jgi:hypothetical protein
MLIITLRHCLIKRGFIEATVLEVLRFQKQPIFWLFGNFRYTHLIDKSGKCFVTDQIELNALK